MNRRQQLKEILKTMDFYQEDIQKRDNETLKWKKRSNVYKHKLAKALAENAELKSKLA